MIVQAIYSLPTIIIEVGDEYFLGSAERIRCFFEEEAFGEDGKLTQERSLCINKKAKDSGRNHVVL